MSQTNTYLFKGLKIVAWILFVGLCIEAGSLILNFIFNIVKPESVAVLYHNLDLSEMYGNNTWGFFGLWSFIITIAVLKAYLFYLVVQLVMKIDLSKPFTSDVSKQILKLSYFTLSIGLIGYIARQNARSLQHHGYEMDSIGAFWVDSQAFVLMAAVIYAIGVIFSKGVEYQDELEETV